MAKNEGEAKSGGDSSKSSVPRSDIRSFFTPVSSDSKKTAINFGIGTKIQDQDTTLAADLQPPTSAAGSSVVPVGDGSGGGPVEVPIDTADGDQGDEQDGDQGDDQDDDLSTRRRQRRRFVAPVDDSAQSDDAIAVKGDVDQSIHDDEDDDESFVDDKSSAPDSSSSSATATSDDDTLIDARSAHNHASARRDESVANVKKQPRGTVSVPVKSEDRKRRREGLVGSSGVSPSCSAAVATKRQGAAVEVKVEKRPHSKISGTAPTAADTMPSKKRRKFSPNDDRDTDDSADGDQPHDTPTGKNSASRSAPKRAPRAKGSPSPRVKSQSSPAAATGGIDTIDLSKALPLAGYKVVFTGVVEQFSSREAAEDFVKERGGNVTSAVSGVTNFLVTGTQLEDGREVTEGSKYHKAKDVASGRKVDKQGNVTFGKKGKVEILTEGELIKALGGLGPHRPPTADGTRATTAGATGSAGVVTTPMRSRNSSSRTGSTSTGTYTATTQPIGTATAYIQMQDNNGTDTEDRNGAVQQSPINAVGDANTSHSLWSEFYRPCTPHELIGNAETIRKLTAWLTDWHKVCILGQVKPLPKASFRGGKFAEPERVNARAALLSGPPGIGKTTSAGVVARACGYNPIEFNASDSRNKLTIEVLNDMTSGGNTLSKGHTKANSLLIMDEMDGLAERGAPQALIKLVQQTRIPVICICNDRMHTKVRAISTKCYDLKFTRPVKDAIARRVAAIARREGLDVELNAITLLCESVGNDIRQILNTLQLMHHQGAATVGYTDVKSETKKGIKDSQVTLTPFDVTKKLLSSSERRGMTYHEQLDCFFIDMDLTPLLVAENYLSALANQRTANPAQTLKSMATAADAISYGDVLSSKMRRHGDWGLLPEVGLFGCVDPAAKSAAWLMRPEFPRWLGKNSTSNKNKRLLNELQIYLAHSSSACPSAMRISGYLDLLYSSAVRPLLQDADGDDVSSSVDACIAFLDEYGLTRDMLLENLAGLRLKSQPLLYEMVDTKVKSTLTRVYNKSSHNIRVAPGLVKKASSPSHKQAKGDQGESSAPVKGSDGGESGEDEDDSMEKLDKLIVQKNLSARSAKAKARMARGNTARAKSTATAKKGRSKK